MMKGNGKYYLVLGVLLVLYVVVMLLQPKETNAWAPSFSKEDQVPYGSRILYERIPDLFPGGTVYPVDTSAYGLFREYTYEVIYPETYVAINTDLPWNRFETRYFLKFISQGNYAFLSALTFSPALRDSLGIVEREPLPWLEKDPSNEVNFYNPQLQSDSSFLFREAIHRGYFAAFDTTRTTVLAHNGEGRPNLIQVSHGAGYILLSTTPFVFTNYHILEENHYQFIEGAFSYLPEESDVLWDEYYKYWNLKAIAAGHPRGRLGYILNQRALRWAWWLLIGSLLLFVAFETKRKQRIVPIVKPLSNLTLEFTETIGRLYFQRGDHHNLAEKKIKVFLEQLRSRYFLRTDQLDETFFRLLSGKSGVAEDEIRELFRLISQTSQRQYLSEEQLITLSRKIDDFNQEAGITKV